MFRSSSRGVPFSSINSACFSTGMHSPVNDDWLHSTSQNHPHQIIHHSDKVHCQCLETSQEQARWKRVEQVWISPKLVITVVFYVNDSSSSWYLYKNHYKVHKHSPDKHVLWSEKTNVTRNEVTRRKNHNVPGDNIFLVDLHLTARLRGISPSHHSATTLHQFWQFGCCLCTSQLLQHSLRKFHEQIQ